MQVKDQTVIHRNKYAILSNALKSIVTIACFYFLWVQFHKQNIELTNISLPANATRVLIVVLLLMVFNWYLEALRWKISLIFFEKISLYEACKSVLGGLALNWILPFTSGDFVARVVARKDKYQATSAVMLNRGVMLALTLGFGVFSLFYLNQSILTLNKWYLVVGVLLLVIFIFFRRKFIRFLKYFQSIKRTELIQISVLSILRYSVFTFQFYWLLKVFNPELISIIVVAGIGWIFFVRSVIPHLLGGIGLRETASVFYFASFVDDLATILVPVFIIWIINTLLPSVVGLILIWRTSFFKSSS